MDKTFRADQNDSANHIKTRGGQEHNSLILAEQGYYQNEVRLLGSSTAHQLGVEYAAGQPFIPRRG